MAIASAIISGVLGTASLVTGIVGSKKQAEAQEKAQKEMLGATREEQEKDRELKRRQQNLQGLDVLAGKRQQAEQMARTRSFNRDALAGMRTAMQRRNTRASTPRLDQSGGLPTTTFGRAA